MSLILVAIAIYLAGGLLSLLVGRHSRWACVLGPAGAVLGGIPAIVSALSSLLGGGTTAINLAWDDVPLGSAHVAVDPLSALFVLPIALVSGLAAIYGGQYLRPYADRKNLGISWFFFNLLAASMLLVVVARNGVLFLMAWEMMSLASFFLVAFESEEVGVRRAAWIYLVAMHLGAAFLLAMFTMLGRGAGSLDFDKLAASPGTAGIVFVLAVIGFGAKAGFMPMHVWLPEAHPAAPSHVSAVMSGVMIKTGIYGLLRVLTLLGPAPAWWGWTLLWIGVVSGVLGVLSALSQHDLKRLLAYHSVENIGIIALGLGVGLLGVSYANPAMAALGFAGALLHVVNHALFKSLLFLGAGSVLHAAKTREIDRLGGLLKRMPATGVTFLVGAAAISGLPPLNGFVSELMIYLGTLSGLCAEGRSAAVPWALLSALAIGSLALIGGLATACFTKAFGVVFLGEPRTTEAAAAHEGGLAMRIPMWILAGACIAIGLSAPLWPLVLRPAVCVLLPPSTRDAVSVSLERSMTPLAAVALGSCILIGLVVLLAQIRRRLFQGRTIQEAGTWDCGYAAPTPRMQYTSSSFARPLVLLFRLFLQPREEIHAPRGLFPARASLHTDSPDVFRRFVYQPLFAGAAWGASKLRWLQQGRIQLYVLYIALTILVLLVWKLR